MSQPTHPSLHIADVRELARYLEVDALAECMDLALQNRDNPCYSKGESEQIMNVLAKAGFVKAQMAKGMTLVEAMRELAKRIRAFQIND